MNTGKKSKGAATKASKSSVALLKKAQNLRKKSERPRLLLLSDLLTCSSLQTNLRPHSSARLVRLV